MRNKALLLRKLNDAGVDGFRWRRADVLVMCCLVVVLTSCRALTRFVERSSERTRVAATRKDG